MTRKDLDVIFQNAVKHRSTHGCGGYPYEYGDILSTVVTAVSASQVLEVGTGLGYTAACMVYGNPTVKIDTIDRDASHIDTAIGFWKKLGFENNITVYNEKAEAVLPQLNSQYDLIFFDAYVPQKKFFIQFERLLKKDGILFTANLFLRDSSGGTYLRKLKDESKWRTGVFADTAIAVKLF